MQADAINSYVVERIRRQRVAQRLRVADMARRTGIPLGSYSCLETGRYRLSLESLFRILAVLGTGVADVWPEQQGPVEQVTDSYILQTVEQAREAQPKLTRYHDILQAVCEAYGLKPEQLSSPSRRRDLSEARTVVLILTREQPHLTLAGLSRLLRRDVSSLSHCLRRLKPRLEYDRHLAERIESARRRLQEVV